MSSVFYNRCFHLYYRYLWYLAYNDESMHFTLFPLLWATTLLAINYWLLTNLVYAGFAYFYIEVTYYKYAFNDLYDSLKKLKRLNKKVNQILLSHNNLVKQVETVNITNSKVMAIAYFLDTLLAELFIYATSSSDAQHCLEYFAQ